MAASYPTSAKAFTSRVAGDTIQPAHVNDLQDEVNAIEAALLGTLAHNVTISGLVSVTGFGTHQFRAGGVGGQILKVGNPTAGVGNFAQLLLSNDVDDLGRFTAYSSTFTTSSEKIANYAVMHSQGGLNLNAGSADIGFYTGSVLRMLLAATGALSHNNSLQLSAVTSPAQIVANTNNYAPASFSVNTFFRLSSDAARDITGLAGGATGRVILLSNQGAFTITLKVESASSTAANRFTCPGAADYALTTGKSAWLFYDATATRWCVIGS